ncbi:MAG: hypothetical protein EOM05_10745 [Clostridia bacterium]|nr:hypothetical protein [Erysipelotrichia bacterium]NCC88318.1 hypothetical protein [Clostridia bacterium]
MAIKPFRKQSEQETVIKKEVKKNKRPNWILRVTVVIIAVPVIILAIILLTSMEKQGEPVVGSRFDKQLNPAIKTSEVDSLKKSLTYDNVDKVEVNLISATLRISIDTNDGLDAASIEAIANDVYAKVNELLPVETYFTNSAKVKMYDLEINVYNLIPDEKNAGVAQIWCVKHKNASEEEMGTDWPTTARNEEVTNQVRSEAPAVSEGQ